MGERKNGKLHQVETDAKWCPPKLVVEVKHLAGSKLLRHATARGFAQH